MAALRRWRLNAPEGYRWTDDEVLGEKFGSFLNGVMVGSLLACVLIVLVAVVR